MTERFHTIQSADGRVTLDLRVGHVRSLVLAFGGREIAPLHTAPWVDDPGIGEDETIAPNLRFLSGDFFCAPFSTADIEAAPAHGWTANGRWRPLETAPHPGGGTVARFELENRVMGARVVKELTLRDGHPFLYERHVFLGGTGAVPVANHAMIRFEHAGRLFFSAKEYGETPDRPLETDPARGRSRLAYPARFEDPARAPLADGGTADLTRYPFAERHEDFAMLVEASGSRLGWAAAVRPDRGDVFLSLKNPRELPVTLLWFSNGGRDYVPWQGRHLGVLGIEEARSFSARGHRASVEPNPLAEAGVPTALALDPAGAVSVGNVIGGLPLPEGWAEVADVRAGDGELTLSDRSGRSVAVPFDDRFLFEGS